MRRIVSLWLPHWPIERHRQRQHALHPPFPSFPPACPNGAPDNAEAFALVRREAKGMRLYALNGAAQASGVKSGMALADARAIVPALATASADVEADAADLEKLALWCMRFTPLVAIDRCAGGEPEGLWLDVTGCTHLFGGEAALLETLCARLNGLGYDGQAAIAPTPGAAFALARSFGPRISSAMRICGDAEDIRKKLAPLPVSLLRLSEDSVADLTRFGLKRIGALYDLPRAALHARFDARGKLGRARADQVLRRLDEALGGVDEPISPLMPPPVLRLAHPFIEPVFDTQLIARTLGGLLDRLMPALERMGLGARSLRLAVFRTDGSAVHIDVATSAPSRDAAHWARLYAERLEVIDAPFGVDMAILQVMVAAALSFSQHAIEGQGKSDTQRGSVAQVVDRIANRFGPKHVLRSVERESHVPERREQRVSVLRGVSAAGGTAAPVTALRPFRLFDYPEPIEVVAEVPDGPPMRFRWRKALHAVARAQGPERITGEWWRDEARLRDYYRVENEAGARFWLYREGRYEDAGEDGPPRWFIHGLFM